MKLANITKDNWEKVIMLTTNTDGTHTLNEKYVESNAYSILQSFFEDGWTARAIELDNKIIGFAMFGFCKERSFYELRWFMIDWEYQNKGYGHQALTMIVEEMKRRYACREIYLSTDPNNTRARHMYEQFGFAETGEIWDGEVLYRYKTK